MVSKAHTYGSHCMSKNQNMKAKNFVDLCDKIVIRHSPEKRHKEQEN